jgi:CBS domain-containing protein
MYIIMCFLDSKNVACANPNMVFKDFRARIRFMGSDLRVGDIMTKDVIVVPFGNTLLDVAKLMKKHSIGSVIIVQDKSGKHAKGIITERDMVYKVLSKGKDPYNITVEKVMSAPLRVVRPETTIEDAAQAMKENKIKRLPVVNEDNELIGILSEGDIMKIFPVVVDLIEEKAAMS